MTDKAIQAASIVCKYDEYFHPELKRNKSEKKYTAYFKKFGPHQNRYSDNLGNTILSNPDSRFFNINSTQNLKYYDDRNTNLKSTRQEKSAQRGKKSQDFKLEKLFPKSVNIKFEQVLDSIPNNRYQSINIKSPRKNQITSPSKIFQMVENKYFDLLSDNKKDEKKLKENDQISSSNVASLFNVKSIKMIRKNTEAQFTHLPDHLQIQKHHFKLQKKKGRKEKNKAQLSMIQVKKEDHKEMEKRQNRKSCDEYQKTSKTKSLLKSKDRRLEGLAPIKSRLSGQKTHAQDESFCHEKVQRGSPKLLAIKKSKSKSKELTPMIFSLNGNSSFTTFELHKYDHGNLARTSVDAIFEDKLLKYMIMIKANCQLYNMKIQFPSTYSRNQFNFYVGSGNNSKLVKDTLKKRWWLGTCQDKKDLSKNNVIWTQLKDKSYYLLNQIQIQEMNENEKQKDIEKRKVVHNHFQQNQFLGNKKALYYNMRAYYESIGENVFDYLPLTLHIKNLSDDTWTEFLTHFQRFQDQNPDGKNIWILKPGENSNRGNGITVHKTVQSIKNAVSQNQKEGRTFILQKYIEKPFLYQKRKFDIRCYMLLSRLNGEIKGFWYKQGYIRTSGYEYTLEDCQNSFIHLTNDAVQQNCDTYGKYEDKNKLSYEAFQKYLDDNFNSNGQQKKYDFERDILPKLKKVCIDSIKACYKCLGRWREGLPTFQLFGLDFMIDESFDPWLIEINTNPCLQTQGRVLEKVIIPLIDNVFKLTIDCLFPPPKMWTNSYKHLISKNVNINLFQLVFQENEICDAFRKKDFMKDLQMQKIGQIDEDSQIYEENEK